jgi:hypothetical protein
MYQTLVHHVINFSYDWFFILFCFIYLFKIYQRLNPILHHIFLSSYLLLTLYFKLSYCFLLWGDKNYDSYFNFHYEYVYTNFYTYL